SIERSAGCLTTPRQLPSHRADPPLPSDRIVGSRHGPESADRRQPRQVGPPVSAVKRAAPCEPAGASQRLVEAVAAARRIAKEQHRGGPRPQAARGGGAEEAVPQAAALPLPQEVDLVQLAGVARRLRPVQLTAGETDELARVGLE